MLTHPRVVKSIFIKLNDSLHDIYELIRSKDMYYSNNVNLNLGTKIRKYHY